MRKASKVTASKSAGPEVPGPTSGVRGRRGARSPGQLLDDSTIAALYAGRRYESLRFGSGRPLRLSPVPYASDRGCSMAWVADGGVGLTLGRVG